MFGKLAVVCLLALALPLHHRLAEAKPGDSTKEKKTQQDTCHDQCKETPSNNPYSSNYPCPCLNQLHYYCTCNCVERPDAPGTFGFTSSEQTLILNFISQMEIVLEGFGGDINDTAVVEVSVALEQFFNANPSIQLALGTQTLNDSSSVFFGTFNDFCNLHIAIQFEVVGPVLAADSSGSCELTQSITAAAQASGNAQIISECQNLTVHIEHLLTQSSFNVTEQLSFIFQLIQETCSSTTIAFLNSQCSISGFGSFQSIFDICEINFQVQEMNSYMSGSSQSTCPLLIDLTATWNATCHTGSANLSVCGTLGSMIDQLNAVISANSGDIEVCMVDCVDIIFQMCKGAEWICDIELGSLGCSLNQFCYISAFCHNEDCCDWNSPPPPLPGCSCEEGGSSSGSGGSGSASKESPTPGGSSSGSGSGSASGGSGSGESPTPGSGSQSESGSGSASKESPTPGGSSSGSGSGSASGGSGSGESPTPGSGSLSESGSGSASKESPTPGSGSLSESGSGSASKESPTPGSGSLSESGSGSASKESPTPGSGSLSESGSGSASKESPTPASASNSGSLSAESGETTPAEEAVTTPKAGTTPAVTTKAVTTPAATTKAGTSKAATTPAGTTPHAPTPTPTMSHCDQRQLLVSISVSCNCSSLFLSITKVTNTWSSVTGQKTSINPVINAIRTILYSSQSMATKIANIWAQINGYNPSNSSWKTQFLSITIYFSDMTTVWGTVGDFLTCTSSCTCSMG